MGGRRRLPKGLGAFFCQGEGGTANTTRQRHYVLSMCVCVCKCVWMFACLCVFARFISLFPFFVVSIFIFYSLYFFRFDAWRANEIAFVRGSLAHSHAQTHTHTHPWPFNTCRVSVCACVCGGICIFQIRFAF